MQFYIFQQHHVFLKPRFLKNELEFRYSFVNCIQFCFKVCVEFNIPRSRKLGTRKEYRTTYILLYIDTGSHFQQIHSSRRWEKKSTSETTFGRFWGRKVMNYVPLEQSDFFEVEFWGRKMRGMSFLSMCFFLNIIFLCSYPPAPVHKGSLSIKFRVLKALYRPIKAF